MEKLTDGRTDAQTAGQTTDKLRAKNSIPPDLDMYYPAKSNFG